MDIYDEGFKFVRELKIGFEVLQMISHNSLVFLTLNGLSFVLIVREDSRISQVECFK